MASPKPDVKATTYNYPPRGMSKPEAARYVGVGTAKFDEMVAAGQMPKPKRVGGRTIWDRLALDAAFTDLPDENPIDVYLRNRTR